MHSVQATCPGTSSLEQFDADCSQRWCSYGYLEDKAFRHGDIEDVLTELLKRTGGGLLKSGSKFKGLDVKRVYFG